MRPRIALAAVLVAASAAAIPSAHAANSLLTPYCATDLHNAAAGASASCATQGPPPVECVNCGVLRTVDIVVATGGVDAKLVCDGLTYTTHVDGPGRGQIAAWGGLNCTTTLTSTVDGTTAVATSTASYTFSST